jgi:hypothetical protein
MPLRPEFRIDAHPKPAGMAKSLQGVGDDVAPADDAPIGDRDILHRSTLVSIDDERAGGILWGRINERQVAPLATDRGEALVETRRSHRRAAANLNPRSSVIVQRAGVPPAC